MARSWAMNGAGITPLFWIGTSKVTTPPLATSWQTVAMTV